MSGNTFLAIIVFALLPTVVAAYENGLVPGLVVTGVLALVATPMVKMALLDRRFEVERVLKEQEREREADQGKAIRLTDEETEALRGLLQFGNPTEGPLREVLRKLEE